MQPLSHRNGQSADINSNENALIAIDWGTTRRRGYRLDRCGLIRDRLPNGPGVAELGPDGCSRELAAIVDAAEGCPILLTGMIGSNIGIGGVGYLPCPVAIEDLAANLNRQCAGAAIVPGVSFESESAADVMRGEEVQILGAVAAGLVPPAALVCQPGTHNKWVEVRGGRITSFQTMMAGELFALLGTHGILAREIAGDPKPGPAFDDGVSAGLHGRGLIAELFPIRARSILGHGPTQDAASYLSGLLIGSDVRAGLNGKICDVYVVCDDSLGGLYCRALELVGCGARRIDAEAAFVSGIVRIAEFIA